MSITLIQPYFLKPVITRTFFSSGYNSGRITTTATTNQVAAQVSTTENSANYVAFWQGTGDNSAVTSDFQAYLTETSDRQTQNIEPQDTTDALAVGGMYAYAGGTNKTIVFNYSGEATTTKGVAGRAVNVLELDSADLYQYNSGSVSTGNLVSVTLASGVEYLVAASCGVSASGNCDVLHNGTSYGALGLSMSQDATTYSPYWHLVKLTGAGVAVSIRRLAGTIKEGTIIALRLDKFQNAYYVEEPTEQSTTNNTFTAALSNTFSLANPGNYHLLLASGMLRSSATNNSAGAKLINTSRNINYNVTHFRENNATGEFYPTPVARITSFVDSSPTIEWQQYSESTNNSRLSNMAIALLDLGVQAPPVYFIGSTTVINSSSITLSDQAEENDIVIIASHSTSTSQNTPTGYTSGDNGSLGTVNYQWSYKIMGSTPDTTASGLTATADTKHVAMVFRYVDTTTPLDTTPQIANATGNSGMPDCPSITSSNQSIILAIGFLDDDAILSSVTAPTGYTICGVEEATGTLMCAYKVQGAAQTDDPDVFGGSGNDSWVAYTIALRLA